MRQLHLVFVGSQWRLEETISKIPVGQTSERRAAPRVGKGYVNLGPNKDTALLNAIGVARLLSEESPVSLRIHKRDGTFQEERTYPRSADPKRSKG